MAKMMSCLLVLYADMQHHFFNHQQLYFIRTRMTSFNIAIEYQLHWENIKSLTAVFCPYSPSNEPAITNSVITNSRK